MINNIILKVFSWLARKSTSGDFMRMLVIIILFSFTFVGCAAGINNYQKRELYIYKVKGMAVEEKSPGTAAGLGYLFGCGSFYTRNYGIGVINLLLWPLSTCWDPVSGRNGAETINYYATIEHVRRLKEQDMKELNRKLEDKKITEKDYIFEKRKIEDRYEIK